MIKFLFVLIIVAAAFVGFQLYSDPLTSENLDQVKVGMSAEEVVTLIGEPDDVEDAGPLPLSKKHTWRSWGKSASIIFIAGRATGLPEREGF